MQGGTQDTGIVALPRKRVPPALGGPHRTGCRCSSCQLARGNRWYHYANAAGSREDAIEAMHDEYDRHPGKRRTPSREYCEVYKVKEIKDGSDEVVRRILFVRKKKREKKTNGGNGGVDAVPAPGT